MKRIALKTEVFDKLLSNFEVWIKVKGIGNSSIKNYSQSVHEFLHFMESIGIKDITFSRTEMVAYYEYLTTRPNRRGGLLSTSSINHHLTAINKLFELLLHTKRVNALPALPNTLKNDYSHRSILTVEEVKYLYSICNTKLETAILSLAYGCGLRRSEIVSLKLADVNLRERLLIVRAGKNNKRREIPLSEKVKADLKAYLNEERSFAILDNGKPVLSFLLNKIGTGLGGDTLYRYFKELLARSEMNSINEKNISLHHLRHSIATHLVESGAEMSFIQSFLGHASIDTSQLYAIHRKRTTQL